MLREASVRATLFLTIGHLGRDNRWPSQPRGAPAFPMMSWRDVEGPYGDGWEIEALVTAARSRYEYAVSTRMSPLDNGRYRIPRGETR